METDQAQARTERAASPVKAPVLTARGGGFRRATAHSRPTPHCSTANLDQVDIIACCTHMQTSSHWPHRRY